MGGNAVKRVHVNHKPTIGVTVVDRKQQPVAAGLTDFKYPDVRNIFFGTGSIKGQTTDASIKKTAYRVISLHEFIPFETAEFVCQNSPFVKTLF